jgi:hypothetical protein
MFGAFHLTISLWMCDGRPVHAYVVFVTKFQEFFAGKLGAVVGDDGVRHSKPVDDVRKEGHGLLRPEVHDWVCLDHFENLSTVTSRWV